MKTKIILTMAVVSMIPAGCSSKKEKQATPKETINEMIDALLACDKAKYMSILSGSEQELKAAETFIDYVTAVRDLKQAVVNEYGDSGWAYFENEGGAKLSMNLNESKEKLDSAKIEINGDTATCRVEGETRVMHLHRRDGKWYVDAGDMVVTDNMSTDKFVGTFSKLTEAINRQRQRVGQAGVTAQSLDVELGREMMKILMNSG